MSELLQDVAAHLYEALRSMGHAHCQCPDCQAERLNAMKEYEALVLVPPRGHYCACGAVEPAPGNSCAKCGKAYHNVACLVQVTGGLEGPCDCGAVPQKGVDHE